MKNELQRHKRSDKVKWVLTSIAFVLAFVMIAGLCLQLFGTGKVKPSEWFKKSDGNQTEEPAGSEEQTTGGLVMPEETKGNGIALMSAAIAEEDYEENGISAQAETAYTVTATVQPENATDKRVTWSVAWKNPSSTWASGKTVTSYVTVTPTSTGALTANLSCLQAFGEVVVLKVASTADSTVAATREINYMKRANSFDFYVTSIASGRGSLTVDKTGAGSSYLYCQPNLGVGTVTGTVSVPSATVTFSAQYCNMSSYITKANAAITSGAKVSAATSKTFSNPTTTSGGLALSWRDFFTATGAGIFSIGSTAENHLKSGIVAMAGNGASGYGKVTATITISYGDVSASYTQETNITKFDVSALVVNPTSVSHSNSSSLTF